MTPTSGKVGTRVTISLSSPYSLDGDYQILWCSTTTFEDGKTTVLATGHVAKGTSSVVTSITVPEATSGLHYIRFERIVTGERIGFQFVVQPSMKVSPSIVKASNTISIMGTGFPGEEMVVFTVDGKGSSSFANTNKVGSFTSSFTVPEVSPGEHQLAVNMSRTYADPITAIIEVLPKESPFVPPTNSTENHAVDPGTNNNSTQPILDRNPPPPSAVSPMGHSFGFFGTKSINFIWVGVPDSSGVTYNLEIANDVAFSMITPGLQRVGLTETSCTVDVPPGTYYWRVKAVDGAGNASYWAYAPYAFRVAEISCLIDELLHVFGVL